MLTFFFLNLDELSCAIPGRTYRKDNSPLDQRTLEQSFHGARGCTAM